MHEVIFSFLLLNFSLLNFYVFQPIGHLKKKHKKIEFFTYIFLHHNRNFLCYFNARLFICISRTKTNEILCLNLSKFYNSKPNKKTIETIKVYWRNKNSKDTRLHESSFYSNQKKIEFLLAWIAEQQKVSAVKISERNKKSIKVKQTQKSNFSATFFLFLLLLVW